MSEFNTITDGDWQRSLRVVRKEPNLVRAKIERAATKTLRLNLLAILQERRKQLLTSFTVDWSDIEIKATVRTMTLRSTHVTIIPGGSHMIIDHGVVRWVRQPKDQARARRLVLGRLRGEERRHSHPKSGPAN